MSSHATQHARQRLLERYGIDMAREDWHRLARQIDAYPFEHQGHDSRGRELRVAQVRLELPEGSLTVPVVYIWTRHRNVIKTVMPGGYWTGVALRRA